MPSNPNFLIVFVIYITTGISGHEYQIPNPKIQLLSPKGIKVSIPDEPGIQLMGFHGSINQELVGTAQGDFGGDTLKPTDGKWVYENKNVFLDPGDILNYWIHVQYLNKGYQLLDRSFYIPIVNKNTILTKVTNENFNPRNRKKEMEQENLVKDEEKLELVNKRLQKLSSGSESLSKTSENCKESITTVNGKPVCSEQLLFDEKFDIFDWDKWERVIEIPSDYEDAEFVSYQNFTFNCYITDGELRIVPSLLKDAPGFNEESIRSGVLDLGEKCTSIFDKEFTCKREAGLARILPPIVSTKLRTKKYLSFRYGQVDIRAKVPKGDWAFPLLLLSPSNYEYGNQNHASGQIRIGFTRGNINLTTQDGEDIDGRLLYGGVVLSSGSSKRDKWLKTKMNDEHFGNRYHTYTVVWDDESITFAVDGKAYATFQNGFKDECNNLAVAEGSKMAPFDKEFFLEIGVGVGGISDFPDNIRSGPDMKLKPWNNLSPKAELRFWRHLNDWYPSWNDENAGITLDRIKIWAI